MAEDNTKFFHAMAANRYRRNSIAMLKDGDGRIVSDHEEMAGMLWSCDKNRMGQSDGINMQLDLARLFNRVDGLDALTVPFTTEEMDLVVKEMPANKAPGPDGFSGLFLKRC